MAAKTGKRVPLLMRLDCGAYSPFGVSAITTISTNDFETTFAGTMYVIQFIYNIIYDPNRRRFVIIVCGWTWTRRGVHAHYCCYFSMIPKRRRQISTILYYYPLPARHNVTTLFRSPASRGVKPSGPGARALARSPAGVTPQRGPGRARTRARRFITRYIVVSARRRVRLVRGRRGNSRLSIRSTR